MTRLDFDLSSLRVLLVGDDSFSRELEMTALSELGMAAIELAHDAEEALDALDHGVGCDLIVADWSLPVFDGAEMVATVRGRWPDIAILMLSNDDTLDQVTLAIEAGVDGCLIRPFSLEKLREAVQLVLANKLRGGATPMAAASDGLADNPELAAVVASIRAAIEPAAALARAARGSAMPAQTQAAANRLAARLSGQLSAFVGSLDSFDRQQLEVLRLHADCLQAALSGCEEVLAHEAQNLIIDGLNVAADLVLGPSRGGVG